MTKPQFEPHPPSPALPGLPFARVFSPWRVGKEANLNDSIPHHEIFAPGEERSAAIAKDEARRRELFAQVPCDNTEENYRQFVGECRAIAGSYCWHLEKDRLSPKPAETAGRFNYLAECIDKVLSVHSQLAPEEARLIEGVAARDLRGDEPMTQDEWERWEREETFSRLWVDLEAPGFAPSGAERVHYALHLARAFERWARTAAEEERAKAELQSGRPPHDAERDAITSVANLWLHLTGSEPVRAHDRVTSKPTAQFAAFQALCRAVTKSAAVALGLAPPGLSVIGKVLRARKSKDRSLG